MRACVISCVSHQGAFLLFRAFPAALGLGPLPRRRPAVIGRSHPLKASSYFRLDKAFSVCYMNY